VIPAHPGGPTGEVRLKPETTDDADAERRVFSKILRRLMPLLIASYVLNYLDRNNIAFAALTMNADIGLTATEFGIGAGMFFVGYCFCEIPSNLVLYRVGARVWLSRIMISWGLASTATIFVTGETSFYLMRLLLGAAEAGFFPGVAFYLSTWFPAEYRTRTIAWFMAAVPISSVVAGPVSGALLEMNGVLGIAGWKWLFILEGLPIIVLGVILLFVLSDTPEQATWLSDEERRILRRRLAAEQKPREVHRFWAALTDGRVLTLAGVQFGFLVGSYGVGVWLPQILKQGDLTNLEIGFVSSGSYVLATIALVLWGSYVQRRGHKIANLAAACVLSAIGFAGAVAFASTFWVSVAALTLALIGINAARGLFWSIPPRFLTGLGAAGGLAFINSVGTTGGFVGPERHGLVDGLHRVVFRRSLCAQRFPAAGGRLVLVVKAVCPDGIA
jgi:MFS transporter, ACS family, tartrate transporter